MKLNFSLFLGIFVLLFALFGLFKYSLIFGDSRSMWILLSVVGLLIAYFSQIKSQKRKK